MFARLRSSADGEDLKFEAAQVAKEDREALSVDANNPVGS
jgi:hypothetical protein